MSETPPDTREFQMTKTESSMIAAYWPKRMEVLGALQKIEAEIGDMKEEMAARLSVVAGFKIDQSQIVNMDWSKRTATVTLPKKEEPKAPEAPKEA